VVEGERVVRNLVASALRKEGYRLLLGGSAEEAVRLADEHAGTLDLLLTEAILPGQTGIELVNALVAKRPHLQVIVMSGHMDDVLGGLDDNLALLKKPFTPEELRQRVRAALLQVRQGSR
jgi:DNA-binding response OmpR family regulator